MSEKSDLLTYFFIWSDRMGWEVPDIHVRALHWLQYRGDLAVLRCFRGFGKSTLLAIYNAWRFYQDPTYRILHQSESDGTAYKTSRDTQNVLRNHPLTKGLFREGGIEQWWVHGATDIRNASMYCRGILSNVTSARADEAQNDDPEVPKNIATPEAREKLRYRLGEQTHILVPGGRKLFIGTPHTHDSLYDEVERMGADCLTIRMFENEYRIEQAMGTEYTLPFRPEYIFIGIGVDSRLLEEGRDYRMVDGTVVLARAPGCLVDFYAGCAWPERFDRTELQKRRRETRTINEFDSQYQLHSKPIHESRLDPEHIKAYDMHPRLETANRAVRMMLGSVQIVSGRAYWDPAKGKIGGDTSAFSLILDDGYGNHYWHVAEGLIGEMAEFDDSRNTKIIGGQVMQICELVRRFNIVHITVETNGLGAFMPKLLQRALKQEQLRCGVKEHIAKGNKNERILAGLEPPMKSGVLWAHVDVLNGPMWDEMKDWNPAIKEQPDGYLDSGSGAILEAPVRINHLVGKPTAATDKDWRQSAGVHEVTFEN